MSMVMTMCMIQFMITFAIMFMMMMMCGGWVGERWCVMRVWVEGGVSFSLFSCGDGGRQKLTEVPSFSTFREINVCGFWVENGRKAQNSKTLTERHQEWRLCRYLTQHGKELTRFGHSKDGQIDRSFLTGARPFLVGGII